MTSLFLNTSSSYLETAIIKDNYVIDQKYMKLDKELSKVALVEIISLLEKNAVKVRDIDEIICVNGPGSFTGLRVGVTIAKSLAWSLNCKLYGASSLLVLASSINDKYIVPIINARHNCFYAGIYNEKYENIMPDTYISSQKLFEELKKLDDSYTLISTEELEKSEIYKPNINNFMKYFKREETNVFEFEPNYLKKTQAEEELNDKRN